MWCCFLGSCQELVSGKTTDVWNTRRYCGREACALHQKLTRLWESFANNLVFHTVDARVGAKIHGN